MLAAGSGAQRARAGLPERANHESEGVPTSRRHHREDDADQEVAQPLIPVGLLGGPGPQRAEPTVDRRFTARASERNNAATSRIAPSQLRTAKLMIRTSAKSNAAIPYPRLRLRSPPAPERAPFLYSYSISRRCPVSYTDGQRITPGRRARLHSPRAHPRRTAERVDTWRSSPGTYLGTRRWKDYILV